MTQTIDDLYAKQVNFTPKIDDLDEVMITLKLEENSTEKLQGIFQTAHEINFDTIREPKLEEEAK